MKDEHEKLLSHSIMALDAMKNSLEEAVSPQSRILLAFALDSITECLRKIFAEGLSEEEDKQQENGNGQ